MNILPNFTDYRNDQFGEPIHDENDVTHFFHQKYIDANKDWIPPDRLAKEEMQSRHIKYIDKYLIEDFKEWNTGIWIHYSKEPFAKIKPKSFHNDPVGIYLFPEKFNPEGSWKDYRYKIYCKVHDLKVLDLSEWNTLEKAEKLCELLKATPIDEQGYLRYMRESKNPIKTAWEWIRYIYLGRPAMFNKAIRSIGYNAVFDDTRSIHIAEIQLLILDPTLIDVMKIIDQKKDRGSGFNEINKVTNWLLKDVGPLYGKTILADELKKHGDKLYSTVKIENGKNYVYLKTVPIISVMNDVVLTGIHTYVQYANPSLNYGAGGSWKFDGGNMEDIYKELKRDLDKIFKKEN